MQLGKRALDLSTCIVFFVFFWPFLLLLAAVVFVKLGRPIFFVQVRPGLKGKPFKFFKFRTMTSLRDNQGNLLPDHLRTSRFGSFLRETSLDELPSLLNVLRGEMSLVGPRPLLMQYVSLYSVTQARRMDVLPGVTGWAQINGRNAITWNEKFQLDVWYVDNWSFSLDLKIIFKTFKKVLIRADINNQGHVTMPAFTGDSVLRDGE